MQGKAQTLQGVIAAPLTPFTEQGKIDFSLLEKQFAYLIENGANGLFVNGTTGEGAYLSQGEKLEILRVAKSIVAGRAFLCAACLQPSTPQVLEELEQVLKLEPDFVVAVPPYYYAIPQEAIRTHFQAIARRSTVPVIMYNIPQCTHNPIDLDTLLELAWEENIAGIKDSSGDFVAFSRGILAKVPKHFSWIMGEDSLDGPAFMMGARGLVSGLSNVWIPFHVDLYRAAQAGDYKGVLESQAKIHQLYKIHQVTGGKIVPALKAGASFFGRSTRWMKIPALTISEEEAGMVRGILEGLHLL